MAGTETLNPVFAGDDPTPPMPYPKGIKDPAVRAAWLAARWECVRRFDALVGGGR